MSAQTQASTGKRHFQHSALGPDKELIRILCIQPPTSSHDGHEPALIGSLETVSLSQKPAFVALSYTWGLPHKNPQHVLQLGDAFFRLTENLYTALQHLRPSSPSEAALRIWVDAVCINQADSTEKADQVRKMRRIYESASQVLVWLGPSADDSDKVLDVVTQFGQAVGELGLADLTASKVQKLSNDERAQTNERLSVLFGRFAEVFPFDFPKLAYEAFAARAWWRRVWVVQELVVNEQEPIFVVGNRRIDYVLLRNFVDFTRLISTQSYRLPSQSFRAADGEVKPQGEAMAQADEAYTKRFLAIQDICKTDPISIMTSFRSRYRRNEQGQPHTLFDMLKRSIIQPGRSNDLKFELELLASDERDRMYALLGLAGDADVAMNIPVNYSDGWTASHVYYATTRALLANGDLETLFITRDPLAQKARGLSTWVCTWKHEICDLPFGDCLNVERPFRAGGMFHKGDVILDNDNLERISIKGVRVGAVAELSSWLTPSTLRILERTEYPDYRLVSVFMRETESFCLRATMPSAMGDEDMPRLMVGDLMINDLDMGAQGDQTQPASTLLSATKLSDPVRYQCRCDPDGTRTSDQLFWLLRWVNLGLKLQEVKEGRANGTTYDQKVMDQMNAQFQEVSPFLPIIGSFWNQLSKQMQRRAWLTHTGFVGLGPAEMVEGDVVVVFNGSPTPCILRQRVSSGTWWLVGEAYVHGIMDGELMQGNNVKAETFILA